ncbi:MAG: thioredoxin domain-containing protein [Acidimicrobiales bacterium]|nr:thioredoxin domain-containing protein [Acidimicrobiales bacterium]
MNRLADESSPYLRQHADNPVDWYPWGEEAFAEARRSSRPVLLSVGYSACHWCHVMAHESFEDPATAELMNRWFVNVKVDREERPDVDAIYMDAVTALVGRGGWPMTVFLDPEGLPFHAGTYWPNRSRGGMPSFQQVLNAVQEAWTERRDDLSEIGTRLLGRMAVYADLEPDGQLPPSDTLQRASEVLRRQHDPHWGGFGGAPKFPQSMSLEALLRRQVAAPDPGLAGVIGTTLDAMASGGMADHLGGGFARYSVDERWLVPHFEKMLYDNALLARTYLHAWQIFGHGRWRQVAEEAIGYVLRDLRLPGGGFAAAEDADSEGVEGRFYVWSEPQVRVVCGTDADEAIEWYGVTPEGNFEGTNILHRPVRGDLMRPPGVERARQALFNARELRIRPGLDDKVLTEWNGLMLSTLAEAAAATGRGDWLEAAKDNAEFLLSNLRNEDGRWLRSWQSDVGARHLGYAADHAAMVDALTRLGEATGEVRWIDEAAHSADLLLELFTDRVNGGFFTTGDDAERLVTRPKDVLDNAHPSANSLAAVALLRLGALTGERRYTDAAESVLLLLGRLLVDHPTALGHLLGAVDLLHAGITEVVITGDRPDMVEAVARAYRPNLVLAWGEERSGPLWEGRDGDRAWVCRDFACRAPVEDVGSLLAEL